MIRHALLLSCIGWCAALLSCQRATAQEDPGLVAPPEARPQSHRFVPDRRPVTEELVKQLTVPRGFQVNVFAKDLGRPRIMDVGPDGTVYVTRREGDVMALKDTDNDGAADQSRKVAEGAGMHGIYVHEDGKVYLATVGEVLVTQLRDNGSFGPLQLIISDLPTKRGHHNRTLAISPVDGMLYITVGSTGNALIEENEENAAMLQAAPDGSRRKIFARGLRNTIGFGWHPVTKELWGWDHGIDGLGDDRPPEELNRILEGKDYGWPFAWGDRQVNPNIRANPPSGMSKEEFAKTTEPMVLGYQAHSSPIQMAFYTADHFPADYKNDAFVAFHGSWNRKNATGYKVVRVLFDDAGQPTGFEDFLDGFLIDDGRGMIGRPAGVAVARDGSLLISDDLNGYIYRVSYAPDTQAPTTKEATDGQEQQQEQQGR